MDEGEKGHGRAQQDEPVQTNPRALQGDCRTDHEKAGGQQVPGRRYLRLGLTRHVLSEVREGDIEPAHDEEKTCAAGDRQDQECGRLEERHGRSNLAVADPGDDGDTQRDDRGGGVKDEVQPDFDVLAAEHRQEDDRGGHEGQDDDGRRQDGVQSVHPRHSNETSIHEHAANDKRAA